MTSLLNHASETETFAMGFVEVIRIVNGPSDNRTKLMHSEHGTNIRQGFCRGLKDSKMDDLTRLLHNEHE